MTNKYIEYAADLDVVAANLAGDAESHTAEKCARIVAEIAAEMRALGGQSLDTLSTQQEMCVAEIAAIVNRKRAAPPSGELAAQLMATCASIDHATKPEIQLASKWLGQTQDNPAVKASLRTIVRAMRKLLPK